MFEWVLTGFEWVLTCFENPDQTARRHMNETISGQKAQNQYEKDLVTARWGSDPSEAIRRNCNMLPKKALNDKLLSDDDLS